MLDLILFLVGCIVIIVSWGAWKKTARAVVRDRLFELRDEWRDHYVDNGLDMQDGTYSDIRDLINGLLRYTKRMRMIGFAYFAANISDDEVRKSASRIDASIEKVCGQTRDLALRIRQQASESVLLYMASTSLGFISAGVVMFAYLLPNRILSAIKTFLRSVINVKPDMLLCASQY